MCVSEGDWSGVRQLRSGALHSLWNLGRQDGECQNRSEQSRRQLRGETKDRVPDSVAQTAVEEVSSSVSHSHPPPFPIHTHSLTQVHASKAQVALTSPLCSFRENAEKMYYFSSLALTLNEPEDSVALTDSRLRPDQRLMEEGRWDDANSEKQRLEEKQRAVRRRREAEASDALDEGMTQTRVDCLN